MKIEKKYALKILGILTVISTIISLGIFSYFNFFKEKKESIKKCICGVIENGKYISTGDCDHSNKINFFHIIDNILGLIIVFSILIFIKSFIYWIYIYFKKDIIKKEKAKKKIIISLYLLLYSFLIFLIVSIILWLIAVFNK